MSLKIRRVNFEHTYGRFIDVVASIAKATKGARKILAIDEGDAISKQFPAFETIDIPEGAFRGRPPTRRTR